MKLKQIIGQFEFKIIADFCDSKMYTKQMNKREIKKSFSHFYF